VSDTPQTTSPDPQGLSLTAEVEVVKFCRELLRIDTSNFGDDSGPGERKAAEYVAGLWRTSGLEVTFLESAPGRSWWSPAWRSGPRSAWPTGSRSSDVVQHGPATGGSTRSPVRSGTGVCEARRRRHEVMDA
jgi:acetylornithine deacetylase/succinyl-diaminopimelate desuccinylase-like protein